MPSEDYQSWSPTAASNSNADAACYWPEGQARASVNNSARSMMAAHAKDRNLKNGSIVTAGTANAQTFLSGVTYTTVPTGLEVLLKIGPGLTSVDGTAVTLNMDGIGAVGVKDQEGEDVEIGLLAGSYARFLYNGTNWVFLDASITNTTIQITQVTVVEVSEGGTPVAFIDFTNLDTTKYQRYEIIGTNILVDTDEMGLTLNISTDNGTTFPFTGVNEYNSSEEYTSQRLTNDGDPYARSFSQTDQGYLAVSWAFDLSTSFPLNVNIELYGFEPDQCPSFRWSAKYYHNSYYYSTTLDGNGYCVTSVNCNAIRLWPTSGNFTAGTFTLYGVLL
jgi:hypothetical protein